MGNVKLNVAHIGGGPSGGSGGENFEGILVTHRFVAGELPFWCGFDGTGQPEGVLDPVTGRVTA